MYLVNEKIDIRSLGAYLKKGQKLPDKIAEKYLKINSNFNITKLKDGKAKQENAASE